MVVLDVKLNNFYAFNSFHMNLTYPKKIVDSSIEEEHLPSRPYFRYKKVNVLLGSNASGKTTFGLVLMKIFNFMARKNYDFIIDAINEKEKEASFVLDLASNDNIFYRVNCVIDPSLDGFYSMENIHVEVRNVYINSRDSYESCVKKIENLEFTPEDNYISELEKMGKLSWLFNYPTDNKIVPRLPDKDERFRFILESVLKTLDPSIKEVKISQDVDCGYVIQFPRESLVVQSEQVLETELLSSGTKSGISIAFIISSLIRMRNRFYYCDEKFSYISTDIEKSVLSLMIDLIKSGEQLFFTTHNTDILDMDLPKHSFTFLRKDMNNTEKPITCIEASSLLKRNTDSLRNAVENDMFSTSPDLDLIYSISDIAFGDN